MEAWSTYDVAGLSGSTGIEHHHALAAILKVVVRGRAEKLAGLDRRGDRGGNGSGDGEGEGNEELHLD